MIWRLVAMVAGACAILAGAILVAHQSPIESLTTLIHGSLGSPTAIAGTLRESTPLLICGLAVFIALRAGLFNIGVEGQLLVGACSCAVVAVRFPGPLGMVLGVLVGMVAGMVWALPAALIKAYRNGHEVITTIMLNNVALFLTSALVSGPIKDKTQSDTATSFVAQTTRLPFVYKTQTVEINCALVLGIVLAVAMAIWLKKTVAGYELQAVGANRVAARFAGISPQKVTVLAMSISGALGGLAGAVQILAYEGRFYDGFSPGYGFDALGVALLAGGSAYAVLPSSLLFGILSKGGTALQIDGVPKGITTVVLGLLIFIAAAIRYRKVTSDA
ncbi:MAG: ABC transporter permease [Fimbriimonas sp.]|nr:ABC transporter permease [Fimbriimonas sp.]